MKVCSIASKNGFRFVVISPCIPVFHPEVDSPSQTGRITYLSYFAEHGVVLEESLERPPVVSYEDCRAVLLVFVPLPLVSRPICIHERTLKRLCSMAAGSTIRQISFQRKSKGSEAHFSIKLPTNTRSVFYRID